MPLQILLEECDKNFIGFKALIPQLSELFQDAIDSGASMGPLKPLSSENATIFWKETEKALQDGSLKLIIAKMQDGNIVGCAQLGYPSKENASIRADVMKVMVHRRSRGLGIGRRIMTELEKIAHRDGKETLVLDVLEGADAEHLYRSCGYKRAGMIPDYVIDETGTRLATVYYFKSLR